MAVNAIAQSRKALVAASALSLYLKTKLATDAKVDLRPALATLAMDVAWKAAKPKFKIALDKAVKGKLALDADISDVIEMLDQLESMSDAEKGDVAEDEDPDDAMDEDADGDDEDDEETKKEKAKKAAEMLKSAAKDKTAKDKDMPEAGKSPISKGAMDAAISAAVKAAEKATLARLNGIRDAEREVQPWIGNIAIAQDSAEAVYRLALDSLGVDVADVPAAALPHILRAQPKPGEQKTPARAALGMDEASRKKYAERFPDANRLVR